MRHRKLFRRRGVTLVELLVVAATVIVLLGLTIPMVRHFRVQHDDLVNLNNLGATVKDFASWALDHNGISVNAGLPESAAGNPFYEDMGPGIDPVWQYRNHSFGWPSVLYYSGFEPSQHWHATVGPGNGETWDDFDGYSDYVRYVLPGTLFRYPDPMWTDSSIWTNPGSGPMTVEEYAAFYKRVRLDGVASPGRKGLLVYTGSLNDDESRVSVAFVDGHAARHEWADAAPAGVRPLSSHQTVGRVVFATLNGYEGVDF